MGNAEEDPLLDVARGDPAWSSHLRQALHRLRDTSDDSEFRELVEDVLQGRRSLRDVAFTPAFERVMNPRVEAFAERYEQLSQDERDRLADEGENQLQQHRAAIERRRRETDVRVEEDDANEWRNHLR